jgi:hypothetical protein
VGTDSLAIVSVLYSTRLPLNTCCKAAGINLFQTNQQRQNMNAFFRWNPSIFTRLNPLSWMIVFAMLTGMNTAQAGGGPLCYVDNNASPPGDGTTWGTAYTDLQGALTNFDCTEIWVAAGTYLPDGAIPGDRFLSFELQSGQAVYGGFFGDETVREERDPAVNVTILSGDIGTGSDETDNAYHVVQTDGVDSTTVLDGFTIEWGYADGVANAEREGAGMYCNAGSPSLANLVFRNNYSTRHGGGLWVGQDGNPVLNNVSFIDNYAFFGGAGVMVNQGSMKLTNATFTGNTTEGEGAGVHAWTYDIPVNLTLANVTFSDNSAVWGGAISNLSSDGAVIDLIMTNVTASGNQAMQGGALHIMSGAPFMTIPGGVNLVQLTNVILWGDTIRRSGDTLARFRVSRIDFPVHRSQHYRKW